MKTNSRFDDTMFLADEGKRKSQVYGRGAWKLGKAHESFSHRMMAIRTMRTTMIAAVTTRCWYILVRCSSGTRGEDGSRGLPPDHLFEGTGGTVNGGVRTLKLNEKRESEKLYRF